MRSGSLVLVLLVVLAQRATAKEPPSASDLRAAYCIGVTQHQLKQFQRMAKDPDLTDVMPPLIEEVRANLRRLRLYLLPRLPSLELPGIASALKQGESDGVNFEPYTQTCESTCQGRDKSRRPRESNHACVRRCQDTYPAMARSKACGELGWLPY